MTSKITLLAALVLASTAAWAGLYQPAPVNVDLVEQFASGDMVSAANDTKNKDVFIGCGTRNFDDGLGGIFSLAFCQALDADGDTVTCLTQNPSLVEVVRSITDGSYIQFSWSDDGAGNLNCDTIGISTQSFYLDKVRPSNNNNGNND